MGRPCFLCQFDCTCTCRSPDCISNVTPLYCLIQARVRGYLVRKKLSSLREEYENIVREIEGDLVLLEWCGETIQRPVFVNKVSLSRYMFKCVNTIFLINGKYVREKSIKHLIFAFFYYK